MIKKTNPLSVTIGEKVLILDDSGHKLDSVYKGPYVINDIVGHNVYVRMGKKIKKYHKNLVKKLC